MHTLGSASALCGGVLSIWAVASPLASSAVGPNLVPNPSFAEGVLEPLGWDINAPAGNRGDWQADRAAEHRAVLLQGTGVDWAGVSSRRVVVTAGEPLTVGAWIQAAGGGAATDADRLFVRFFRAGRFVGQSGPSVAGTGADWRCLSGSVRALEDADSADVSLQVRSSAHIRIASACLLRGGSPADVAGALPASPPPQSAWRTVDTPQNLPADRDGNGLADRLESWLGVQGRPGVASARLTRLKTTSFQTPTGYRDDNDLKVDVVIVAGNEERKIRGWQAMGYEPHVMVGFRAGLGYLDGHQDGSRHWDEVQTDSRGKPLTCGPGSYYMVPTENRRQFFRQYFADAVRRGAKAVCPEEPEFFARAGHSPAFKREWTQHYGGPWQDPSSSVDARLRASRLGARLERLLLQACYEGARSAAPSVPRFLLTHSPLNYTSWGIVFGHNEMIATGLVDAVVAQVWTGTARTHVTLDGQRRERTFENAFLEYASCVGLTRGRDVDLWFLMDPLEDNLDRSMEDYRTNYHRTLAAALMFPEVIHFETMPWPTRIFGRVPDEFATTICSVINVLSDMQNQPRSLPDADSAIIGTFMADSAMWQRGQPHPGDLDCFYGLALPLLTRGLRVGVPNLERVMDAGYLDPYRLLLLSYDMLKPAAPEINDAIAGWVRAGGCLVVVGGSDPYNAAAEWWREQGFESPQDHLLARCGFDVSRRRVVQGVTAAAEWTVVARTTYEARDFGNRRTEEIDLTPFLATGRALVKCEDSRKDDGWGALIMGLEAEGVRGGEKTTLAVAPSTAAERELIAADLSSNINPDNYRFCDHSASVVYRFDFDPGSKATLRIDIGNQYMVSAAPAPAGSDRLFRATTDVLPPALQAVEVPLAEPVVQFQDSGAHALLSNESGALLAEKSVGQGTVLFLGTPPSWFARSPEAATRLRALVQYGMERKLGLAYREQTSLTLRRGRYTIARTFEEGLYLPGRWVDVLDADLPTLDAVDLPADSVAVLYDAGPDTEGGPRLLFSSSCVEWKEERPDRLRIVLSGAGGVAGTCRIFAAGRRIAEMRTFAAEGAEAGVQVKTEGDTILLRYPNAPSGIAVDLRWEE